jgi:hypothetical protein
MKNELIIAISYYWNVLSSLVLVGVAVYVLTNLKIRMNLSTRIKWYIIFFSILLRQILSTYQYLSGYYGNFWLKYYALWLLGLSYFMVMLMLFITLIGSWYIQHQVTLVTMN